MTYTALIMMINYPADDVDDNDDDDYKEVMSVANDDSGGDDDVSMTFFSRWNLHWDLK